MHCHEESVVRLLAMHALNLSLYNTSCDNLRQFIPIIREIKLNFQNLISQESFHA